MPDEPKVSIKTRVKTTLSPLGGRDFLSALALSASLTIVVGLTQLFGNGSAPSLASTGAFTSYVLSTLVTVSITVLVIVLAVVTIASTLLTPDLLARLYLFSPEEFAGYSEVLFFPAWLGAAGVVVAVVETLIWLMVPATGNPRVVASTCIVGLSTLLLVWQVTALLEALAQVQGLIRTRATRAAEEAKKSAATRRTTPSTQAQSFDSPVKQ